MSRVWLAMALAAVLLVVPSFPVGAQSDEAPHVSLIRSVLSPPFNFYSVEANDPEGATLSYRWSLAEAGVCTFFTSEGRQATWRHDDEEACPHDAARHPGTITVVVSDGTWEVTRIYRDGTAPFDPGSGREWDAAGYDAGEHGSTTRVGDDDGTDPRDTPPPEIYGEEIDCAATDVAGAFQPAQAVWQDNSEVFPDKPGKRFVTQDPKTHTAELAMVADKPTALFGVLPKRDVIHFEGRLLGFVMVPAEVHFVLEDANGERIVHRLDVGDLPIRGDCVGGGGFDLDIPAALGVPDPAFGIAAGDYTLRMRLVEKVTQLPVPDAEVTVTGHSESVPKHRAYFVPVMVSNYTAAEAMALVAAAKAVAPVYASEVPDFFPLRAGDVGVATRPIEKDLRAVFDEAVELCFQLFVQTREAFINCEPHAVRARVEADVRSGAWALAAAADGDSSNAPDRVVVWVRDADMDVFKRTTAQAFAPSTKTVFVRQDSDHWDIAHEIVHTLPRHLWSRDQMTAACDVNYHNIGNFGYGPRLTKAGSESRRIMDARVGLMGPVDAAKDYWIEQCTYWHLLSALKARVDPPLLAVQGFVGQDETTFGAAFADGFSFEGIPDLTSDDAGAFALAMRGPEGALLARYRFDLAFEDDEGEALPVVSFGWAVPRVDGAASFDIEAPNGTALATRTISANAPTVALTTTSPSGDGYQLAWRGDDADGDALNYTLAVSPDAGESWYDVVTHTAATEALVDAAFVAGDGQHVARLVVSDGVLSTSTTAVLREAITPPPDDDARAGPGSGPGDANPDAPDANGDDATPGLSVVALLVAVASVVVLRRRR